MRRAIAVLAVGALALGVAVALADAPKEQYAVFDPNAATIADQKTFLEWQRFPEKGVRPDGGTPKVIYGDLATADAACKALGPGWRLPTIKELLTIVDEDPHRLWDAGGYTWRWIDRNAFPETAQGPYWSSSAAGTKGQWAVDFATGTPVVIAAQTSINGRCVREY